MHESSGKYPVIMEHRYHALPPPPDAITPGRIIGRMFAGMGFRFYWATHGMTRDIYTYQPAGEGRTIGATVDHIWDTLNWIYRSLEPEGRTKPDGPPAVREDALDLIGRLEDAFAAMDEETLNNVRIYRQPFWLILNGPLADMLTHVGQIASLRRMAGSPVPASNPFRGSPPREE
jgi:hypothetical protein